MVRRLSEYKNIQPDENYEIVDRCKETPEYGYLASICSKYGYDELFDSWDVEDGRLTEFSINSTNEQMPEITWYAEEEDAFDIDFYKVSTMSQSKFCKFVENCQNIVAMLDELSEKIDFNALCFPQQGMLEWPNNDDRCFDFVLEPEMKGNLKCSKCGQTLDSQNCQSNIVFAVSDEDDRYEGFEWRCFCTKCFNSVRNEDPDDILDDYDSGIKSKPSW